MNIAPLFDRVVIKQLTPETKTTSGFILSPSEVDVPNKGTVVAVGPGRVLDNGQILPVSVAVGDLIAFHPRGNINTIASDDGVLLVLGEEDVLAVLT